MFRSATPVSVAELAQLLIARKKEKKRTILFLGTRTGGLFGNQAFYTDIQRYSNGIRRLNGLSDIEKFHECHHILKELLDEEDLRDKETKDILEKFMNEWLQEAAERDVNNYVAQLIKDGFFDIVISTNMDLLLEDTLGILGMRELQDYTVINMLDNTLDRLVVGPTPCSIIKVFGDLVSGNYKIISRKISWSGGRMLRGLLNSLQYRDMLAIGYDPIWDEQVESVLLGKGELWYVDETLPEYASAIRDTLERNQGKYLVGLSYERVFKELYSFIQDEDSTNQIEQPDILQLREKSEKSSAILDGKIQEVVEIQSVDPRSRKVFISYSHKDEIYLKSLLAHLNNQIGYEKDLLEIWCDTRFDGGEDWHKEIQEAITKTNIAIFLVSVDFLGSSYIKEYELLPLKEAASKGEATLLSVIVSPCELSQSGLHQYHLMNNPSLTLQEMNAAQQARVWMKTAKRVKELLFPD